MKSILPSMISSYTSPTNANIGDYWFNPVTSKVHILKRLSTTQTSWSTLDNPADLSVASITLTSSQIQNLNGTPQTIIPAPMTGQMILPIIAQAQLNYGGSNQFTNTGNGQVNIYFGSISSSTSIFEVLTPTQITANTNQIGLGARLGVFGNSSVFIDTALIIGNSSTVEFGGNAAGDNTIDVNVWYLTIIP